MPLFCKQCESRRLPVMLSAGEKTMWLCEKCKNFVDMEDFIIRESKRKLEEFEEYEASKD